MQKIKAIIRNFGLLLIFFTLFPQFFKKCFHHLTALMVTHNMKDAIVHGNRLIMMWDGKIILDIKGEELSGILITHEHIDHIAGLGVLSRRYGIPIYTTEKTADAIQETKSVGKIPEELFHPDGRAAPVDIARQGQPGHLRRQNAQVVGGDTQFFPLVIRGRM